MGLFNNYDEKEKQLLKIYIQSFIAMGVPDAKKTAKNMLNKAIEKSKEARTYYLPHNFGDIMLGVEKAEQPNIEKVAEIFRRILPQKRDEGVIDEDIRWWWNLNDVERQMMLIVDDFHFLSLFISERKSGKTEEESGRAVWEARPIYTNGDPCTKPERAPFELKREDFPLPIELKNRVNRYIEKITEENSKKIKKDLRGFSTFNAFVREKIKIGDI